MGLVIRPMEISGRRRETVIDAKRPGLQVGEGAMDPGQHDMGGHVANDIGIVSDVGRAWIGCPSIGFDGCALSQVGRDKTVQRGGTATPRRRPL